MHYHFVESLSTLNRLIFELVEKTVPVEMKGVEGSNYLTTSTRSCVREWYRSTR